MISTYLFVAAVAMYTFAAAVTDLRQRRIPNYLTVPAALLGLLFHSFAPGGWGFLTSLAGFAVGFGLLLLPWIVGGGGMGDVKLLAALGAWFGPRLMLIAFALSMAVAFVMACGVVAYHAAAYGYARSKQTFMSGAPNGAAATATRVRVLPFAVPVAVCTWGILLWFVQRGGL